MALQYAYGAGAYGVGQYATSVFAVSSTTAIADADAVIVQDAAATTGSVSGESAAALLVRTSAGTAESSSGTAANAWRVRDGEATADATSAINEIGGEFIVAAAFLEAATTSESSSEGLRIGTGGATVATVSVGEIVAQRIQQPTANAASFSGRVAWGNYTARGQTVSQTTVSSSASAGRILWLPITLNVSSWAASTPTVFDWVAITSTAADWQAVSSQAANWDDVTDNATANWQTLGANGLPLAA
jgi:hypothetical protein